MSSEAHGAGIELHTGIKQPYHLVTPSPWPIVGALGGGLTVFGIIMVAHFHQWGFLIAGIALILATMFLWWRDVVKESRTPGLHTTIVRLGLRYGMTLFIASEVMFFVAFFWAYFNFALFPDNVGSATTIAWPPVGIHTFAPFSIPFFNTMILLLSGTTVTWAHHSLLERDKRGLVIGLGLTVLLGMTFTAGQAIEYSHAPFHLWMSGSDAIFPSVFFLATGFHGFHVIVGTCFLIVCFFRALKDQFTPERHFGFEAAAWYWHFVDVVWLFLFTCIYLWGASAVTVA